MSFSEQEILRRESLAKLREMGIDPYPAPLFPVNSSSKQIKDNFENNPDDFKTICLAG